ncbi:MAG: carbohydrate-binding protein [Minicystis sp.]
MKKTALAPLTLALSLLSTSALAANANVTGPLGDGQLVRGKKLGMSYLHYGPNGADTTSTVTVNYGFNGSLTSTTTMSATGYGNRVAFIDVPANATGFWYTLSVSDGSTQNFQGAPFALPVHDRAVSVAKVAPGAGTMAVKYAGSVTTTYDTYLHLGWNNWNDVGDAFMQRSEFSYTKAGVYYDYNYVNIDAPWWANYLDFVFKDARNGGTWDNNDGHDWHQSLHPFVTTNVNDQGNGFVYVTVGYADGGLNPVTLHYGVDGWQGVADVAMQSSYGGGFQAYLTMGSNPQTMNFVFTDGNGNWDNNYGNNWSISLH